MQARNMTQLAFLSRMTATTTTKHAEAPFKENNQGLATESFHIVTQDKSPRENHT